MNRRILHISVPLFPLEVERVVDPSLRGRPVAIATSLSVDGQILLASQEARKEHAFPSLPIYKAMKHCPALTVLPYNGPLYQRAYKAFLRQCRGYSPLIEPYCSGHAYLDITGMGRLMGRGVDMAYRLCKEFQQRLQIPAKSGIGNSKLISRVADMMSRSEPVFEVLEGSEQLFLEPLSVGVLTGFASEMARELMALNLRIVRDIIALPARQLVSVFGNFGYTLYHRARGMDPSPLVLPERPLKLEESIHLSTVTNDLEIMTREVLLGADRLFTRLRQLDYYARRAELVITYADKKRSRKSTPLQKADYAPFAFIPLFAEFTRQACSRRTHVERIGISLTGWTTAQSQFDLFDAPHPRASLVRAIDRIRERYSFDSLLYGAQMR